MAGRALILVFVILILGSLGAGEAPTRGQQALAGATPAMTAATVPLPAPVACDRTEGSCYVPPPGTSWQLQLSCDDGATCTNLGVRAGLYAIDWEDNPASTVSAIHGAGGRAVCHVSAGTWEDWRSDAASFPSDVIGEKDEGWAGEKWLDVRAPGVLPIMGARLDVCRRKGFDGVLFDNVDGWQARTGFPLNRVDYVRYSAMLANAAHARGLSAAFANAVENLRDLLPYMDWFLIEECSTYGECGQALPFTAAGKFVGGIEYRRPGELRSRKGLEGPPPFCSLYERHGISGLLKDLDLDSFLRVCTAPRSRRAGGRGHGEGSAGGRSP